MWPLCRGGESRVLSCKMISFRAHPRWREGIGGRSKVETKPHETAVSSRLQSADQDFVVVFPSIRVFRKWPAQVGVGCLNWYVCIMYYISSAMVK